VIIRPKEQSKSLGIIMANMLSNLENALENIYISPLEKCNLNCRLCYTHKTKDLLTNKQILDFIEKYSQKIDLKSVLFCGGEVFVLPGFPELVNRLIQSKIFITVITNGTLDRLAEINDPTNCQLLVSLDGPEKIHDQNRGTENFAKSIAFIKKALNLGFPTEVMFLITQTSYPYRDSFPQSVSSLVNTHLNFNYITQKTNFFNPKLNAPGLTPEQILEIKRNYPSIPKRSFGCFQLSLQSNGLIYGCCESPTPIAKMTDSVETIIESFKKSLVVCEGCSKKNCQGCCSPDFLCSYVKELGIKNCREVVELLR
jgi:sulfatase maturation enzyme AslB (radical SAM superfamily)